VSLLSGPPYLSDRAQVATPCTASDGVYGSLMIVGCENTVISGATPS
jgi:hypothetical protein